jgi:hypothetical protein
MVEFLTFLNPSLALPLNNKGRELFVKILPLSIMGDVIHQLVNDRGIKLFFKPNYRN